VDIPLIRIQELTKKEAAKFMLQAHKAMVAIKPWWQSMT
jgi:hypothetical protein